MKRPTRQNNGTYKIKGKTYKELFGSRAQVHHGTAYKTSGGLTTADLIMNKNGRIVSALKHKTAKRDKRLKDFLAVKGKFGPVKRQTRKSRK